MFISTIKLNNFKGFSKLQLRFQRGLNIIAGENGSGKTTALLAVAESLCDIASYFNSDAHYDGPLNDAKLIRVVAERLKAGYRFEQQLPIKIEAEGEISGESITWVYSKTANLNVSSDGNPPGSYLYQARNNDPARTNDIWPIVAFYRANRNWKSGGINELNAATKRVARGDGYRYWWDATNDATSLQTWVVSKCLERFQVSSETGELFSKIEGDELDAVNRALRQVVEGSTGLRYDMQAKTLFIEWNDSGRTATQFDNLSDGQRAIIYLTADIARRICMLNPNHGAEVCELATGVVLIDEIDVHLHPRWQRSVVRGLLKAFPLIQFIATSHSPQVIGEVSPEDVLLLTKDGARHPAVTFGLDSSSILEEVMGSHQRTHSVHSMISATFKLLELGELDRARSAIEELERVAPGIPEISGAKALLGRKEILGR